MLVLSKQDVIQALTMADAISAMEVAFNAFGNDQVEMPVRTHLPVKDVGAEWLIMPSYVGGQEKALAVKVVGVFPENRQRGLEPILGLVTVADPETGKPLAVLEGASLTGIRTAAVSGVATKYLARADSSVLGILGSGIQARTHAEAICCVREISQVKIFSRTRERVEALVSELRQEPWAPDSIEIANSGNELVEGCDIICACTSSSTPVFEDGYLKRGVHINAIGLHAPDKHEIPPETVVRSEVFVDQRKVALHAGDLNIPINQGLMDASHVRAELGELVANQAAPFNRKNDVVTLFKSVGLAMEDAVAAQICLRNATKLGLGQRVEF